MGRYGWTRSVRYAAVNGVMYANPGRIDGPPRMGASELDYFEIFNPDFEDLSDDGDGPETQLGSLMSWRRSDLFKQLAQAFFPST